MLCNRLRIEVGGLACGKEAELKGAACGREESNCKRYRIWFGTSDLDMRKIGNEGAACSRHCLHSPYPVSLSPDFPVFLIP